MRTAEVTIERFCYSGWDNCYCITDGNVELIATSDIGPRIMRCGFVGGQNLFYESLLQAGKSGESKWMMRGGHRLWIAPETIPDSYALDNASVQTIVDRNVLTLLQPVEPETLLQKEMTIKIGPASSITVTHRIENTGSAMRQLAPWALSQMAQGGTAFTCFPPRAGHDEVLQPTNPLVMWAYTDFTDERYTFLKRHLVIRQDVANIYPQKVGVFNEDTVCGYLLGSDLFVKRTKATSKATYPDFGTSAQIFVNGEFLELETLGPTVNLQPGESVSHVEQWSLNKNVNLPVLDSDCLDGVLSSCLAQFTST